MNRTCGNCKFKGEPIMIAAQEPEHGLVQSGFFPCRRIVHNKNTEPESGNKGEHALVVDGSGYHAALCVEEDFGCNLWEPKD